MGATAKQIEGGRKSPKAIKGGEVISRMLAAEGVEKVFGIIDGTYFGFYSTLRNHGIDLVTPRHETCAVHMAGAYARVSGKLGVCMASNGPGVANVLPGVAVENAEGNRVLLVTSSRRTGIIAPDRGGTFQFFPQVDVIRPMAKWSCAVRSIDRLAEIMRRALRHCFTGRPGVVHVDVPEDLMNSTVEPDPSWFRAGPEQYRPVEPLAPSAEQVARAAQLLAAAERPLIHAGSGVIHALAGDELAELARLVEAPITTSWGARAAVDERGPHAVPMIFLDAVNTARQEADLVLVLGSRLGETDWWGKPPYWAPPAAQKLIQVDTDPEHLGNIRPTDLPIQADVKVFLRRLNEHLAGARPADLAARRRQVNKIKEQCRTRREEMDQKLADLATPMCSAHVAEVCQAVFDDSAVMVIDGGNTAVWGNFYHEVRGFNTIVTTSKMGMLGAGISQALGAQVACPDRQVYCVTGDGAMGFHMQEIETAVRNELPVVYVVVCDKQWGMVKINQQFALKPLKPFLLKTLDPTETINTDLGEIAWDRVAQAMGARGERVADPEALRAALRRARAARKPTVIHADVDPVKHMWAPDLKAFKEMHEEPRG